MTPKSTQRLRLLVFGLACALSALPVATLSLAQDAPVPGAELLFAQLPAVQVTGVAVNQSSAKVFYKPVSGARDYRVYDVANPHDVKYAGMAYLIPGVSCPGYACQHHFASADGTTASFPYQIANGASGGPQVINTPATEIEWNNLGDGQSHSLIVEAVDALGPVPQQNLYTGLTNAPLASGGMLGANKGHTADGNVSTNGQGPFTNAPRPIAVSQAFVVQANSGLKAIPSSSAAGQQFYDTFDDVEASTLARIDPTTYSLNDGTPKEWSLQYSQANNRDSMPFIGSNHFMDMLFDGATPNTNAPTHTSYGSMSMSPAPTVDMSGGKILHLTMEVDAHQSFRRWLGFALAPASDPLTSWNPFGSAINSSNRGIFLEQRDGDCTLKVFTGPAGGGMPDGANDNAWPCGWDQMFNPNDFDINGLGRLDSRSRLDFYVSQSHAALFEDDKLITQADIPAGSFAWADQPVRAYFTHYLYHSNVDVEELMSATINSAPLCYQLNSYWFNDPLNGRSACGTTYPAGYGFPYSDERHWDNMGFEVLPASSAPASDYSPFLTAVALPAVVPPSFTGTAPTSVPAATAAATAMPTTSPTAAPTATNTPVPSAGQGTGAWKQVAVFNNAPGAFGTRDVVNDKNRPTDFYAAAQNGSPYLTKSIDYGQTWHQITPTSGAGALNGLFGLAIVPSVGGGPATLLTGTNSGVWKSTDGGLNWTNYQIGPAPAGRQDVYAPVVDPYDPTHMLLAAHENSLLYQSTNSGQTWSAVSLAAGMSSAGTAFPFFIDTGSAGSTRTTWLYTMQDNSGTWRTNNGGLNWSKVSGCAHNHGADQIYQAGGGVIYMGGEFCGVQRSSDYGVTWAPMWPQNTSGFSNTMTVVFGTPNNVYAENSGASGCCGNNGPSFALAAKPATAGQWSHPIVPAGMDGAGSSAIAFDGSNWIIVTANWGTGLWRYVEPATGGQPAPTATSTSVPTATSTSTVVPATATATSVATSTAVPTATPVPTAIDTPTPVATAVPTDTPAGPIDCAVSVRINGVSGAYVPC